MESYTIKTPAGDMTFTGIVLGASTSEVANHSHIGEYAPTKERAGKCKACRWQETTLYRTNTGTYVALTVGRSILPDEKDFIRVVDTDSPRELIELLTVKGGREPFIPAPAMRALAQAADRDDAVCDAYDNRAVLR